MDNALDEVWNVLFLFLIFFYLVVMFFLFSVLGYQVHSGATYVNVNMLNNKKDGSRMLLIEGIYIYIYIYLI